MSVKLFVGGLSFSTSTDRLREAFARFGSVSSAAVMTDRETGKSRGFGFIEMSTPEEAEQAIGGLNGTSLDGRTIRVDKATPRGAGGPRPAYGDRRPPGAGPGGPRPAFGDRRPAGPGGFTGRPSGPGDRPGAGRGDQPARRPGDRPGRGFGEPPRSPFGDSRRGQGSRRGGAGDAQSRDQRKKPSGPRKGGPMQQRRSNDRGRRTLGDEGGYRPF